MNKKILITGGTGLVGTLLSEILTNLGCEVGHLSRSSRSGAKYKTWQWNVKEGKIDQEAITFADTIVHLAGAGVADKRWTEQRKAEIYDSRIESTKLLYNAIKERESQLPTFIAASAVGYYGSQGDKWLTEEMPPGDDFLAKVCDEWEKASEPINELGTRVARLRIGIVLSTKGGALEKMLLPAKFGAGAYFGNGKQYYPWIHIEDLCMMIIEAIENDGLEGNYNAVATQPVTNKALAKAVKKAIGRPGLVLPAPETALRLAMGEMAYVVLMSTRASSEKIEKTGFKFLFDDPETAIRDLIKRKI
ncbi:MAG: TIGR01777 family oxidoreductase [Bacteroidota bacterium]